MIKYRRSKKYGVIFTDSKVVMYSSNKWLTSRSYIHGLKYISISNIFSKINGLILSDKIIAINFNKQKILQNFVKFNLKFNVFYFNIYLLYLLSFYKFKNV